MIKNIFPDIRLSRLQIKDAAALRKSGLMEGSRTSVEQTIRHMIDEVNSYAYVYRDGEELPAMAFIKGNYYGNSAMLQIRMSEDELDLYAACLSDLLKIAFLQLNFHKVSIVVSITDKGKEQVLADQGFIQEAVLHDEILNVSSYEDAALFYINAAQFKDYSVCFVPFVKGILAVYGGQQFIDNIEFLSYGGKPGGFLASEKARYYCLLDGAGNFLQRSDQGYDFSSEEIDELPFELSRAYIEFKEYFLKKRIDFDLNLRHYDATDFQKRVWEEVKKIPYGATISYEDIALKLTDNDIKAARKLSRAVGNACSENPLPIVVPCHRVIGKNGMLMGFSGGIEFKDYLLQNEMFPGVLPLG